MTMADIMFTQVDTDNNGTGIYDMLNKKVSNADVVAQKIFTRLNIPKSEWVADPTIGVSLNDLSQFEEEPTVLAQVYADIILQVPNVTSVDVADIATDDAARKASVTLNVSTTFGNINITV